MADTCCYLGDATGGMVDALEAQEASAVADGSPVVIEPSQSYISAASAPSSLSASASTSASASASAFATRPATSRPIVRDEHGVVGMQLMMVSSSFALSGHYDEELMDLIGRQVRGCPF